jgi:hypothetical protein
MSALKFLYKFLLYHPGLNPNGFCRINFHQKDDNPDCIVYFYVIFL